MEKIQVLLLFVANTNTIFASNVLFLTFMFQETILFFTPNLRTEAPDAASGYTWGKPAQESNILRLLPQTVSAEPGIQKLYEQNCIVSERWLCSDDQTQGSLTFWQGMPVAFSAVLEKHAEAILGPQHVKQYGPYLGCIMKQLDTNSAREKGGLSVQVHPKSGHPSRPSKPEMWKGEGHVYIGWKETMNAEKLREIYTHERIEAYMHSITMDKNTLILVAGGLVHAIRGNSFLCEWSKAPGAEDIAKGNIKDATIALWDRTDGKTPRPGKEDLEGAIEVMEHADMLRETTPENLLYRSELQQTDKNGNHTRALFRTPEVYVDEYTVQTQIDLSLEDRGLPLYVESGVLNIFQKHTHLARLEAGTECFLPYALQNLQIVAEKAPCIFQTWYAPLENIDQPTL
ncbi:hypothetical protein COW46_04970 [Candidatus Gracilibacteria bacterium CG17_big_fil_post_rev_8_21_14_2_50_48_13]|nr:MAG: hypothetical protein COW46_04970 [Candidatus Gracilibacteria bacterium CG17_big_fil_post_rev_8_21_14_2_50_48_13]